MSDKTLNWIQVVQKQVDGIRFGVVQITIHNGEVVQVERTEKIRIETPQRQVPVRQGQIE